MSVRVAGRIRSRTSGGGRSPAAPGISVGHPLRGYPASVASGHGVPPAVLGVGLVRTLGSPQRGDPALDTPASLASLRSAPCPLGLRDAGRGHPLAAGGTSEPRKPSEAPPRWDGASVPAEHRPDRTRAI